MSTTVWFDAVARIAGGVDGIKKVHGGGKGDATGIVMPMSEDLMETPAALLGHDGFDILASPWQQQTHDCLLSIWIERTDLGEAFAQAIAFMETVPPAFEARSKAFGVDSNVQSVVLTRCEGIQAREWPRASNRWYLVEPWRVQVRVNRSVNYQAA